MKTKQILFTAPKTAEYLDTELPEIKDDEVLTRMEYTVISGGTEKANLVGEANTQVNYPKALGYCGVGIVEKIGSKIESVKPGDRVLVYHGCHREYNINKEILKKLKLKDIFKNFF